MDNFSKSTSLVPFADLPRQKLLKMGIDSLTDTEVISILLNTGSKEKPAIQLAAEILGLAQHNLNELGKLSLSDLQGIRGMGEGKSALILAALELGRRRQSSCVLQRTQVKSSNDIADYIRIQLKDSPVELFGVLFLNRANRIKAFEIISRGGLTGTVADPKVILKRALDEGATQIVIAPNPLYAAWGKHKIHSGTLNPAWEKQNKLSPLTIYGQERKNIFTVELLFSPNCYERSPNMTALKRDWLNEFQNYVPSW